MKLYVSWPHINRIFIMVIASIVYTVFFKILGLVQNDLESTGIFALISSDWSQGNTKNNFCISAFLMNHTIHSLFGYLFK